MPDSLTLTYSHSSKQITEEYNKFFLKKCQTAFRNISFQTNNREALQGISSNQIERVFSISFKTNDRRFSSSIFKTKVTECSQVLFSRLTQEGHYKYSFLNKFLRPGFELTDCKSWFMIYFIYFKEHIFLIFKKFTNQFYGQPVSSLLWSIVIINEVYTNFFSIFSLGIV